MLPQKTFYAKKHCLTESDFDVTGLAKPQRIMEIMQDAATEHADALGFGWDALNAQGLFWALSKVKIAFRMPVTRRNNKFTLYTWPVSPKKMFVERRFTAVDDLGNEVFSASSMWLTVEKDARKIADAKTVESFYKADFDDTPAIDCNLERIFKNDNFVLVYQTQIRRSQLDINRHVNNTRYVDFAADALNADERISQIEITYHKELWLGDVVEVYCKREQNALFAVGERGGETSFTVKLILER